MSNDAEPNCRASKSRSRWNGESLRVQAGTGHIDSPVSARVRRLAECRNEQKGAYSSHSILLLGTIQVAGVAIAIYGDTGLVYWMLFS